MSQVIVDGDSNVSEVRFAKYLGDNTCRKRFERAVRAAASKWKYSPLEAATSSTGSTVSQTTTSQKRPFNLWYIFRFEIKGGVPLARATQNPWGDPTPQDVYTVNAA